MAEKVPVPESGTAWSLLEKFPNEKIKRSFNFTIKDFLGRKETNGESLDSNRFLVTTKSGHKSKWFLSVYPKGETEESKGFVSIFLFHVAENDQTVTAEFKLRILGKDDDIIQRGPYNHVFKGKGFGHPQFLKENILKDKLVGGDLIVRCDLCIYEEGEDRYTCGSDAASVTDVELAEDVGFGFDNLKFTDFIIICENTEIKCHKFMLASRSPVFMAMFEINLKEVKEGKVDIVGLKAVTVEHMLQYMYSGNVSEDISDMEDLLVAADRYQMDKLKSICEKKLIDQLDVNNVIKNIVFADKLNANKLKKSAMTYLGRKKVEVMKIPDWSKPLKDCSAEFFAQEFLNL